MVVMKDMDQFQQIFLFTLQAALSKKGISQRMLAQQVNISQKTINNYFTGRTFPDVISLLKICEYLEIDLWRLLQLKSYEQDAYYIQNKLEFQLISCLREMDLASQKQFVKGMLEVAQCIAKEEQQNYQKS